MCNAKTIRDEDSSSAFTLIELLVTIAVIAILAAMLLPALSRAKYSAKNILCVSRLKQLTVASLLYCDENDDAYPDRGIDVTSTEPLWARWSMRMNILSTNQRLDDTLDDYIATDIPVWCCPLYRGGKGYAYNGSTCSAGGSYGCPEHGLAHNGNAQYMTYSFHGGLKEWGVWNPGDRRKIGTPYKVDLGSGNMYESGMLWSDTACGDNSWVPCAYPAKGFVTSNHKPPPGPRYAPAWNGAILTDWHESFNLAIYGTTFTNWAYDDGSAETRKVNPNDGLGSKDWTAVDSGGRYMLLPNN